MRDRVGRKVGGGGGVAPLVVQCWHEGLGTREPVVVMHAFVSSSIRSEPYILGKVYALVDACGGRVPGFYKLAFVFGRSLFNDDNSAPVEGVAGCETLQAEKGILILSSDGAFVFLHTCGEL